MLVEGIETFSTGGLRGFVRLRAEYYEYVRDPVEFVAALKKARARGQWFTYLQETLDQQRKPGIRAEVESISVVPLSTFEHYWKKQLNDKTRNMVRKAGKAGVEVRICEFDDRFVQGIVEIYNENPMRQGKPFAHYGKDFATIKREHESYPERSVFLGAFAGPRMIGFIKLVHGNGVSNLMQIISMISERDKAPTNALISKAVELCCERGVKYLHYGLWSKRGLGDFKKHHRFEQYDVVRYYVPLTLWGRALLALRLHKPVQEYVPDFARDWLVALRAKWNTLRYGKGKPAEGNAQKKAPQAAVQPEAQQKAGGPSL
jgi:hypothetical protein